MNQYFFTKTTTVVPFNMHKLIYIYRVKYSHLSNKCQLYLCHYKYIGVSLAFYVNDIIDYIIGWHNPDRENIIRLNLGDCSKVYFTEI